jgi:hypothetical protein
MQSATAGYDHRRIGRLAVLRFERGQGFVTAVTWVHVENDDP